MVFIPTNHPFLALRSVLFVPAANARALEKTSGLEADALIFDLEDSVSEEMRDEARSNLIKIIGKKRHKNCRKIIRITSSDIKSHDEDLAVALALEPDAVLLPKVEQANEIAALAEKIEKKAGKGKISIWAMIETPLALVNLVEICKTDEQLSCLVVGPNDLAKTTGTKMIEGRQIMLPWLMQIIATARAFELNVLDGVYNDFRNLDGFKTECLQGAEMGFDGKTLIHPGQIEMANKAFSPSKGEIERAKMIITAFEEKANQTKGVIQIDGEMVERLHLDSARKLLALVEM